MEIQQKEYILQKEQPVQIALQQQLGSTQGSVINPVENLGKWEVISDTKLNNFVPAGSRMMQKQRTFRKGEIVFGKLQCKKSNKPSEVDLDGCFVWVEDGLTYRFPAKGLQPAGINQTITGRTKDSNGIGVEVEEPSFFEKNKTPIIIGAALIALGVGYYFWKKNM